MHCKQCGQKLGETVTKCPICKSRELIRNTNMPIHKQVHEYNQNHMESQYSYRAKSRVVAGLLQILFGGFGIGRLYLGYYGIALGQIFTFPLFFIGGIWGVIDGILILCGQVEYDANGVLLR